MRNAHCRRFCTSVMKSSFITEESNASPACRTAGDRHAGRRPGSATLYAWRSSGQRAEPHRRGHRRRGGFGRDPTGLQPTEPRPGAGADPRRVGQQRRRLAQRARDLRAWIRPFPDDDLDRRRAGVPAGRQPHRCRPLPDRRPCRGAGLERLCVGAGRSRRAGRRDQPGDNQAGARLGGRGPRLDVLQPPGRPGRRSGLGPGRRPQRRVLLASVRRATEARRLHPVRPL